MRPQERVRRPAVTTYDYLIIQLNRFKSKLNMVEFREDFGTAWEWNNGETITDLRYVCVKDKNGFYFTNPDTSTDVNHLSPYIAMHDGFIILKGTVSITNLFEVLNYLAEKDCKSDEYFARFKHLGGYKIGQKRVLRVCYDSNFRTPLSMKRTRFFKQYDYVVMVNEQDFEINEYEPPCWLDNDGIDSVNGDDIESLDGFCGIKRDSTIQYRNPQDGAVLDSFFSNNTYRSQVAFEGPMTITQAFAVKCDVSDILIETEDFTFLNTLTFEEVIQEGKLILVIKH
jgi:hypothetical protein